MKNDLLEKKTWSLPEAYAYCERLAKSHYENFPVGSRLIPKKIRPYVWVLYAFARIADDFADENIPEQDRLPSLARWQDMLKQCYHRRVNHPIFLPLSEIVRLFDIPEELLSDLITAFKMDVNKKTHASFEELLYYCKHSANPVGRLVLYLFGIRDPNLQKLSDHICTALQLANFWQDVNVDLEKGRIYIPLEDFEKFDYNPNQLRRKIFNEQFQRLLAFEVQRTKKLFRMGADLPKKVGGRLGLELRCVILGGMEILKAIEKIEYDTLHHRPHLGKKQKIKLLGNALFRFNKSVFPHGKNKKVRQEQAL